MKNNIFTRQDMYKKEMVPEKEEESTYFWFKANKL